MHFRFSRKVRGPGLATDLPLAGPRGVLAHDGVLYVADTFNGRVLVVVEGVAHEVAGDSLDALPADLNAYGTFSPVT